MKWVDKFFHWIRRREIESKDLDYAIHVTFSTPHGRMVLDWLFADYYMSTCGSTDALKLAGHNGAREVIQQIIERFDRIENPEVKNNGSS